MEDDPTWSSLYATTGGNGWNSSQGVCSHLCEAIVINGNVAQMV